MILLFKIWGRVDYCSFHITIDLVVCKRSYLIDVNKTNSNYVSVIDHGSTTAIILECVYMALIIQQMQPYYNTLIHLNC